MASNNDSSRDEELLSWYLVRDFLRQKGFTKTLEQLDSVSSIPQERAAFSTPMTMGGQSSNSLGNAYTASATERTQALNALRLTKLASLFAQKGRNVDSVPVLELLVAYYATIHGHHDDFSNHKVADAQNSVRPPPPLHTGAGTQTDTETIRAGTSLPQVPSGTAILHDVSQGPTQAASTSTYPSSSPVTETGTTTTKSVFGKDGDKLTRPAVHNDTYATPVEAQKTVDSAANADALKTDERSSQSTQTSKPLSGYDFTSQHTVKYSGSVAPETINADQQIVSVPSTEESAATEQQQTTISEKSYAYGGSYVASSANEKSVSAQTVVATTSSATTPQQQTITQSSGDETVHGTPKNMPVIPRASQNASEGVEPVPAPAPQTSFFKRLQKEKQAAASPAPTLPVSSSQSATPSASGSTAESAETTSRNTTTNTGSSNSGLSFWERLQQKKKAQEKQVPVPEIASNETADSQSTGKSSFWDRINKTKTGGAAGSQAKPEQVYTAPDGKQFSDRNEYRRYLFRQYYTFADKHNETCTKYPGEVDGQPFNVTNVENSCIRLLDHSETVHVENVSDSRIFIASSSDSVFLRSCRGCTITVACKQLRTRDCSNCAINIYSKTAPIIETSHALRFGPFNGRMPNLTNLFKSAGLNPQVNQWKKIFDFNKDDSTIPRPHWSFQDSGEYSEWVIQEEKIQGEAVNPTAGVKPDVPLEQDDSMQAFDIRTTSQKDAERALSHRQ